MTDAHAVLRFIAEATRLDPELARWTAAAVWRGLSPARRRRIRDDLLRGAARLLPPASAWQKARALAALARRPDARPDVSTAAGLVALGAALYRPERRDRQLSAKHLYRIVFRNSPVEMGAATAAPSIPMLGSSFQESKP